MHLAKLLRAGCKANAQRDLAIAEQWFPLDEEAAQRGFKLQNMKDVTAGFTSLASLLGGQKPTSTRTVDRRLSPEERAIAEWLLRNSPDFLPQLDHIQVTGQCSCGCPTLELCVADDQPAVEPAERTVAEAYGEIEGRIARLILLQSRGHLTRLEAWYPDANEHPARLPDLNSLMSI
jgi:hypothetical protein